MLAPARGRARAAVRRRELVQAAWPHGAIVHDNTLDVYIARLRRKLGDLPARAGDHDRARRRLLAAMSARRGSACAPGCCSRSAARSRLRWVVGWSGSRSCSASGSRRDADRRSSARRPRPRRRRSPSAAARSPRREAPRTRASRADVGLRKGTLCWSGPGERRPQERRPGARRRPAPRRRPRIDARLFALPVVRDGIRYGTVVAAVSLEPYEETERTGLVAALLLALGLLGAVGSHHALDSRQGAPAGLAHDRGRGRLERARRRPALRARRPLRRADPPRGHARCPARPAGRERAPRTAAHRRALARAAHPARAHQRGGAARAQQARRATTTAPAWSRSAAAPTR